MGCTTGKPDIPEETKVNGKSSQGVPNSGRGEVFSAFWGNLPRARGILFRVGDVTRNLFHFLCVWAMLLYTKASQVARVRMSQKGQEEIKLRHDWQCFILKGRVGRFR
jgi:hypothetical protein